MATAISGTVDREKMPPNVLQSNGGPGPKMGCPHKAAGIAPPRGPYTAHSPARRRLILGLVTIAGFLGPLSLTIDLPGLPTQATLLRTSISEINATIAVFQAVLAVAPVFWGSWADYLGRKPALMISLPIYILGNILLAALPPNIVALFILRILTAFGAASVISAGAGTVADIVEPKKRGYAMSIVLAGPQMGAVMGPLLGGGLLEGGWQWPFGFLAILAGVIYVLIIFLVPETLRSLVGTGSDLSTSWIAFPKHLRQPCIVDSAKFPRPPRPTILGLLKLLLQVPVLLLSMTSTLLFSAYWGINVTLTTILQNQYHYSTTITGVLFLAPGLCILLGSTASGRLSDWYHKRYAAQNPDKAIDPSIRLKFQIPGILLSVAGLFMYGWFAHNHVHVSGIIIAASITAFGMSWTFILTTVFLTQHSRIQPATLLVLANMLRNSGAAVSAAIIEPLVRKMGLGWCFSGLAFVQVFGVAAVVYLVYGRRKSPKDVEKAGMERSPGGSMPRVLPNVSTGK